MYEKEVTDFFRGYGLQVGSCSYSEVAFSKDSSDFKTVLTTVFPYWFEPKQSHNISIYSILPDYHIVVGELLDNICKKLKAVFPDNVFEPHVDVSPINEKKAAVLGGLGFIGKNTLLINEKYGSFLFIGDICTDAEIELNSSISNKSCKGCSLCSESCPGKALDDGFCSEKCISFLTQKKGELSEDEKNILIKSDSVWGCDICSLVCPHNKNLPMSEYALKYEDKMIYNINEDLLEGLSNGEFKRKFHDRAFVWRGVSVLRRNLEILKTKNGKE